MSELTKGTVITSFAQLERGLRDWRSFVDPDTYDVAGMMTLLCACLENLRKHVLPEELNELRDGLSEEDRAFLKTLAESR